MTELDSSDLRRFVEWSEAWEPRLDEWDYLTKHLTVASAALLVKAMFPDFVRVNDCVLIRSLYTSASFLEWWERTGGNARQTELHVNRLHLWHYFDPDGAGEDAALDYLASKMALTWQAHAGERYPDRRWKAEVVDDYGPTVLLARAD